MDMRWQALIFDRDGTLFDSLAVILKAFNYGIEPFADRIPSDSEWFAAFGPAEPEVMAHFIPVSRKREAYSRFIAYYKEHFDEIALFPEVTGMLAGAKDRGAKIGLFTGGGIESTRFCLQQKNLLPLFDILITGDQLVHPKPHPEGILKALGDLNVDASQTLVTGDSSADVEAGARAGTSTALVKWSSYSNGYHAAIKPNYVFNKVVDFREFLFQEEKS
jgi:HAD superfamily hydrolase (TIGR01549 family)